MPLVRQLVLDTRRHFGEAGAIDNPGLFEAAQAIRQGLGTNPTQRSLQFTEAAAAHL